MCRSQRIPPPETQPPRIAHATKRWNPAAQLGRLRYSLLLWGVLCQALTVWITWPLWQSRTFPPHLPTFDLAQISFGGWMLASLALALIRPRVGVAAHASVLVIAAVFDQFRLQPQFFAIAILMAACVWDRGRIAARWFLASTWLWAGLHKLLSSDWFGHASYGLLARSGIDAETFSLPFAILVALTELVVGLLACVRPRWAAIACLPLHLGIVVFLSPVLLGWNESVIPWNLATAITGSWVLWQHASWKPARGWEAALAAAWMIAPAGFFVGWIDHGFAGVLYSDQLPRGLITTASGVHSIRGWGELAVPFPNERRTLRMYFEQWAEPGDKLHVSDPRPLLADQFYVLDTDRRARPIDADTFFALGSPAHAGPNRRRSAVAGVGLDEQRAIFALRQADVRMVRQSLADPIYAVAFTAENFDPALLKHLGGLPNLVQVQLGGTAVHNEHLRHLAHLRLLAGLGLNHTAITDAGLAHLRDLPYLQYIECEGTAVTAEGLESVLATPPAR